jgi:hypothetical protein
MEQTVEAPIVNGVTFKVRNRIPYPGMVVIDNSSNKEHHINEGLEVHNCTFIQEEDWWFKVIKFLRLGFLFRVPPIVYACWDFDKRQSKLPVTVYKPNSV